MPETASLGPSAAASPCSSTAPSPSPVPGTVVAGPPRGTAPLRGHRIRSRIGVGPAGGFYPAPHRYQLYLSEDCPRSLRISITLGLLGLRDSVTSTLLTAPSGTPDARAALRAAYEATWHHYDGPLTAPALCDRWSGRIVSNHTPDILRDLGELPGCRGDGGHPGCTRRPSPRTSTPCASSCTGISPRRRRRRRGRPRSPRWTVGSPRTRTCWATS